MAEGNSATDRGPEALGLIEGVYRAWSRGDLGEIASRIDEDFEWSDSPELVDSDGGGRGACAFERHLRCFHEAWSELRWRPRELSREGQQVTVVAVQEGRGKASGVLVGRVVRHVWTVREGSLARLDDYGALDVARQRESTWR